MTRETELRIMQLLELMRMENNAAERETQHGDGWLYDHAGQLKDYSSEIDELRAPAEATH